jgi:hypothetical protein
MKAKDQIILRGSRRVRFSMPMLVAAVVVIAAVLVGAWSLFWYFAMQETQSLLEAWMGREKSVDRVWTCPDRQIAGYPFKIEISCANAGFSGEVFGKQVAGSLKGIHFTAALLHPDQADAAIEPPFEWHSADGDSQMTLQWDSMQVRLDGLPQDLEAVSIEGTNVSLQGGIKGFGALTGRAGNVNSTIAAVPERRADDVYTFHIMLQNVSIPVFDSFLGSSASDAIKLDGTVTKADFRAPGKAAERLDHWRQAGGQLDLSEAMLTRGTTKIAARGALRLDDQHRPQGQLDAQFTGAEPLLKRFGINPALIGAGSLLTSLLGGKPNNAPAQDGASSLHLPVTLRSGFVSVGPVKTNFAVPPLY